MDFSNIDLEDHQKLARIIIKSASLEKFKNRAAFEKFRNKIVKENKGVIFHNLYFIKAYNDLLKEGGIEVNENLLSFIRKRSVRTMSGVAPVTVLMKPYPCPGKCIYCPTDVRMPKSYLPSQPAAQRAFRQRFNPYTQVFVRLKAMQMTGHEISKVELRIIGGSFTAYEKKYQTWFIKRCLQAMNEFHEQISDKRTDNMQNLIREKKIKSVYGVDEVNTVMIKSLDGNVSFKNVVKENETSKVRCIGINIETRPDLIEKSEVKRMRRLGITKVEMGVQTTSDEVQEKTCRGHGMAEVRNATCLLKDSGFKIGYHMMPNLPGSTVNSDKRMIGELFDCGDYQPDYLKIYPCVVMPKTWLSHMYNKGDYKSYSDKVLENILYENLKDIPYWCRIDRIARDIPSDEVESGFKASNIRQILETRMKKESVVCKDIRGREIGADNVDEKDIKFVLREYDASEGKEIFLSYEDVKNDKILALLRLRFSGNSFIEELSGAALVREVHVYGKQIAVGKKGSARQHLGFGIKLLRKAEELAKKSGYGKIAVISGIGTREYYKKWGYELDGTYMVKAT